MHPDATIDVKWNLDWKAANANAWELGLKFHAPKSFDTLSWSRDGLWTFTPADHIGANVGSAKSGEISFRSTKRDANWAILSAPNRAAVALLKSDGPLHVRAAAEPSSTTLFASAQVAPPHDFSSNLVPEYEIHLKTGQSVGGSFQLRAVENGTR